MKRLLIMSALWGAGTFASHAQTLQVMAEQLAALQMLQQTTGQDYNTMTTGVQNIGRIDSGEYELHQTYFGSLDAINPSIIADPKVANLRNLQNALLQQINAELYYWRQQQNNQPLNRLP